MAEVYYRQCLLKGQRYSRITWIPEKYAEMGRVLKLRNDGVWSDGWVVQRVGTIRQKESQLGNVRKEIKAHRKNTGDSLPK